MNSEEKQNLFQLMIELGGLVEEYIKLKKEVIQLKEEIYRLNNRIIKQHNTLCEHGLEEYGN